MSRVVPHTHIVDGVVLVVAEGDLDLAQASGLRAVLRDAIAVAGGEPPEHRVVLDLSTVPLLDASIVGVLVGQRAQAKRTGVRFGVVGAGNLVLGVLEVVDLAKPLGAYDPRDSAPARPDLPCCTAEGKSADALVDELAARGRGPAYALPNEAIGALLTEAAGLPDSDPHRRHLRARAIELALPATHQVANRYRGRGERDDDLYQVASVGLIKAIDGYDPTRGHHFSDYALPTILGELRRHFRDHGWGMRVPRRVQELLLDARRVHDGLTQQLNRSPEPADVAGSLGVDRETVEEAYAAAEGYRPQSLSTPLGDGVSELGDVLGATDPAYELIDNWQSVSAAIEALPERTRRILALRFWRDLSQAKIAEVVGLSQMHVSRLLSKAYADLREALLTAEPPDEDDQNYRD